MKTTVFKAAALGINSIPFFVFFSLADPPTPLPLRLFFQPRQFIKSDGSIEVAPSIYTPSPHFCNAVIINSTPLLNRITQPPVNLIETTEARTGFYVSLWALDATGVVIESTSISAPIFFRGKYDSRVGMANCGLESRVSEEKYRSNIAQNSMQIFFFFYGKWIVSNCGIVFIRLEIRMIHYIDKFHYNCNYP